MNINKNNEELLKILRIIDNYKLGNQRKISKSIGLSLGKINFLLKALKRKGVVKVNNFKNNKNKKRYLYYLTPQGIALKIRLTKNFMKIKINEYDALKKDLEKNI
jgi:EPS-associated MarR family transcriptional regulator